MSFVKVHEILRLRFSLTRFEKVLNVLSNMWIGEKMREPEIDAVETYDVEDSFPMLMATCVKYMRESLNERFVSCGQTVSTEQWIILTLLASQDGVSQKDIAERSNRSEVSALNLLKKLEKEGLVIRLPDPVDKRSRRIFLTTEGRKLQQSLIASAKANMRQMTESIPLEDIQDLKKIVRKITNNLKR